MSKYDTLKSAWSYAKGVLNQWDSTLDDPQFKTLSANVQADYVSHLQEACRHLNECLGIMQRAGMDKPLALSKRVVTPEQRQGAVQRARQEVQPVSDKPKDIEHMINPGG